MNISPIVDKSRRVFCLFPPPPQPPPPPFVIFSKINFCFNQPDLPRHLTPAENTIKDNALGEFSENQESEDELREEDEDDDEASVLALREQLLKSMANKRAAKSSNKNNESKVVLKNDGLVPIDDVLKAETRAENPAESRPRVKTAPPPKVSICSRLVCTSL